MITKPLEKLAWLMIFFSACFNIKSFFSDLTGIEFFGSCAVVFFVAFAQFYLSRHASGLAGWSWSKVGCIGLVSVMFMVSVFGASAFWMTTQNSDYMKLRAAEIEMTNANSARITALAILNNCNHVVMAKCVTPRTADYKAAEQEFNKKSNAYHGMVAAQSKSETMKILSESFGLSIKQYFFYRAFVLSFLLETLIVVFSVLSASIPIDKPVEDDNQALKKTVDRIKNRGQLSEIQRQVLAAYESYEEQEKILKNGLPSPMSQFCVNAFGANKQGGTHKKNAVTALYQLGFIDQATFESNIGMDA